MRIDKPGVTYEDFESISFFHGILVCSQYHSVGQQNLDIHRCRVESLRFKTISADFSCQLKFIIISHLGSYRDNSDNCVDVIVIIL